MYDVFKSIMHCGVPFKPLNHYSQYQSSNVLASINDHSLCRSHRDFLFEILPTGTLKLHSHSQIPNIFTPVQHLKNRALLFDRTNQVYTFLSSIYLRLFGLLSQTMNGIT